MTIYQLSKVLTETRWIGIDVVEDFIEVGQRFLKDNKFQFIKGDFYELSKMFPPKSFDISLSIQTLTWLPRYEDAMEEIMAITKKWIFVTSLFSDFNVDVFSNVFLYDDDWSIRKESPYNYNIYSLNRFKDFCLKLGAKEVIAEDFIIDIDLPVPESKEMGTYTIKQSTGSMLQFSGPILMPWKMIAIRI